MKVIILAAGKGTRMGGDLPKVAYPFKGKTMIEHIVSKIIESGIDPKPIVVVGYKADIVQEALTDLPVSFVFQSEQKGTGHAVKVCKDSMNTNEDILVLYGDHPLVSINTLKELEKIFEANQPKAALITYTLSELDDYNGSFKSFGRILRDNNGNITGIREMKDASEQEQQIKEVNPAYYAFSGKWLWDEIDKLNTNNAQGEFYLTDLIEYAVEQKQKVISIKGGDLKEALGINTPEQLEFASSL